MSTSYRSQRRTRPACRAILLASSALMAAGCAQSGLELPNLSLAPDPSATAPITTGSIAHSALPAVGADDALAKAHPADGEVSETIARARSLREQGKKSRALAVLDAASAKSPDNKLLLRERGLLSAELGRLKEARDLLKSSIDPNNPDWRTHSALGSALAAEDRHTEAQTEFATALGLAPDHPSILNNLALSYALDGKHERAEALLRQASTSSDSAKTRQNLALLLSLKGNSTEASKVAGTVLPQDQAVANSDYLSGLRNGNLQISKADKSKPEEVRQADATGR